MSLNIPKIRAICFDVDGTLNDTDDLFERRIERIIRPMKFFSRDLNPRRFARKIVMFTETPGNLLMGIPDKLGIDKELAAIGDYFYQKAHKKKGSYLMIPGVVEMLTKLDSQYPLAIVSARGMLNIQSFLNQFELNSFFKCIASSQTCKHTKPYPDPILWTAEQLNVQPDECLMVGDTVIDIRAAKAANAQSVGVLCGFGEENELREAGADLILESTTLITDFLLSNP